MEWFWILSFLVGGLLFLLLLGVPVAFAFLFVNIIGILVLVEGVAGQWALVRSVLSSLTVFTLVPIPLFVLMGAVLFHSGMALRSVDAIGVWLGRMPGRLSVIAGSSGALFSAVSGSTIGNTALLGSMLLPEMRRRGYSNQLSAGPILASGGLAMIVPPSALAIVYGTLAGVSIGQILVAGVVPGILMAVLYGAYTIGRAYLDPGLAPAYETERVGWLERVRLTVVDIVPLGGLVILVVGAIFLGVATPTEAAAIGSLGAFLLSAVYGRLDRALLVNAMRDTASITGMTFFIIAGSQAFSQLLALSGASRGLLQTVAGVDLHPLLMLLVMQLIVLLLGTFMEQISIMMLTIPLFTPVVALLGFDPLWFAILMLINLQIALTTPPFGLLLFVMKGVAPPGTRTVDLYRSVYPYILCDIATILLLVAFPFLVTWLPSLM